MSEKLGGQSFKFASSPLPYVKPPPALPNDKQSKEFLLTMIFSHVLIFNGVKITNIEVNKDDSHGQPDTKIVADGIEKGIQLTKISLNDPLKRINLAERSTNELLILFPDDINLDSPINVYIYLTSKDKNAIPKGNLKQKEKLVELITNGIRDNKTQLFGENPSTVYLAVEDNELNKLANSITIHPVNAGHNTLFKGKNGIHINYEFDTHQWDENDLNKEINRIIESKRKGQADILLIWGDKFELLYQDKRITDILIERFSKTEFKEVFFLTLFDRVDMFWESWKVMNIK
jgi:hypothetical protein